VTEEWTKETVAVLGAGSWGVAIARQLDQAGHTVRLWEFEPYIARQLAVERSLPSKLPGIELPQTVEVTDNILRAIEDAGCTAFVTPSSAVRATAKKLRGQLQEGCLLVTLAKGTDIETGERMTEIIEKEIGQGPAVALLGPSHAEEVAREIPTAVVAASTDIVTAERAQAIFATDRFRVYTSTDPIGVELGAALKNIVAIAAGIVDGLGYDSADNLKGALITRGLAEIARLGVRMGADPETFAGLSGVGDLITTCLSKHSRNRHVGEQIGRGKKLVEILATMTMVAEGVNATKAALNLSRRYDVDMPIARAVGSVLFDGQAPAAALDDLMSRPLKPEIRR
jgi:glycerol-3-phosphate dehydrogenase (NAD(P)+)